jgi:hypothetical protein
MHETCCFWMFAKITRDSSCTRALGIGVEYTGGAQDGELTHPVAQ